MAIEVAEGKRVRVRFDGAKCIHSRGCVLSRPDVFVPNVNGEWIFPDRASDAELAELAHQCPSGAIRVETLAPDRAGHPRKRGIKRVSFARLRLPATDIGIRGCGAGITPV